MVSHQPAKFGGNRQCDSEDIIVSVFEEQDSICSYLNWPLQFISV